MQHLLSARRNNTIQICFAARIDQAQSAIGNRWLTSVTGTAAAAAQCNNT
jgi:hypothetical protein